MKRIILSSLVLIVALSACMPPSSQPMGVVPQAPPEKSPQLAFEDPAANTVLVMDRLGSIADAVKPTPTVTNRPASVPQSIPTATAALPPTSSGPDQFPAGIDPLTGQPCQDQSLLSLPPALVSVTNFPVTARPQAGLSYSPFVFEVYIGEGMTRFLALFYCHFPQEKVSADASIGPVRSGRLPYESLRKLYNGFLVMASASAEVGAKLGDATNVYGSDARNINSALVDVTRLQEIARKQARGATFNLTGNLYDEVPPQGGKDANLLWVFYNFLNQVQWKYNPEQGAYLRFQDNADGSGQFTPSTDRLNGEQLAFDNVVVLFADHKVLNSEKTLIDFDLLFTTNKAYLFRDGKVYPIRWTTVSGEYEKSTGRLRPIRFVDQNGKPIALKPGNTWVEFVHLTTNFSETNSGSWKARFYAP